MRKQGEVGVMLQERFVYDSQNRMVKHYHQVDNNPEELLAENTYNDLSQLTNKKVRSAPGSSPLQSIDYNYNIRGWMTGINDPENLGNDLFGYKIKYHDVEGLQTPDASDTALQVVPKYNGNIAEVAWKTGGSANEPLKRYGYVYDRLNRLSAGFYQNATNPSLRKFCEKVTYDLNGNINTLKRTAGRMGPTALLIDNLTYSYENGNMGNRLQRISDVVTVSQGFPYKSSPTDIEYDMNGNMTSFRDKNISSIQYNYLNLPKQITQNSQVTDYVYRADGVKVKKLFNGLETDYLDGFQYKFTYAWEDETGNTANDEMKLRIIPTAEGYFDVLRDRYFYNYTDHLGNVRLSYFNNGGSAEVLEENNYYPFGMKNEGYNPTGGNPAYQYKFNGKELQEESGMYDYGARFYMPDIGRWGVVDPLAEKMTRHSPYNYAFNNPIRFIDPDGRQGTDWVGTTNASGSTSWKWDDNIKSAEQAKTAGYDDYRAPGSIIDNGTINGKEGTDGKTSGYLGEYE